MAEKKKKKEMEVNPEVFLRRKLLGRKLGMTQIFQEDGVAVSVTVIEAGPCTVVQVKSDEKDGYSAVQVGFEEKTKKISKPLKGHFDKSGVNPQKKLCEFKLVSDNHDLKPGSQITVNIFDGVKKVDVSGIGKGKGFAGTIKKWHFTRGPESHGSMNKRRPGAIGQSASPSRVFKGLHMASHLGAKRITTRNLKLVKVDPEENLLLIEGAVPGAVGAFVEVSASRVKQKKQDKKA